MTNNKIHRPRDEFDRYPRTSRPRDEFDKNFKRLGAVAVIWAGFCLVLGLSLLAAVVFAGYKTLVHFGIL